MVTLKTTLLVPYRTPDLEAPVVVEQAPAARAKRLDRLPPLGWFFRVRLIPVLVEHHITASVEHVGKVVDRVPVREPRRQPGVSVDRRIRRDHRCRGPQLGNRVWS